MKHRHRINGLVAMILFHRDVFRDRFIILGLIIYTI